MKQNIKQIKVKQMKKYKSREGSVLNKEQAQRYGSRIEELMNQKKGKLLATDVLSDARKKKSPLNDFFEWDDTQAAISHRLNQARYLLRNIVEVVVLEGVKTEQRSFFCVKHTPHQEGTYITLKSATTKVGYRKELLQRIINHLENTTQLLKLFQSFEK